MKKNAVDYWNDMAAESDASARDAVLCGFRSERDFDAAGREDAEHLLLPFVKPTDVVLDVGCGLGRLLKWVAPACRRAIGLDVSKVMLAKARRRLAAAPNVTLAQIPLSLRLPVPDRGVDFAYFYHVSEHMDREDAYQILREIRRCLRPGGAALVQFSLIDHADNRREFVRWAVAGDDEGVRSRFYTEPEVCQLLAMVGLFPQHRLYIPGEFAVVVSRRDRRPLGAMPLIRLSPAAGAGPRQGQFPGGHPSARRRP
ncbi:MAG: class I SAM-dependent methyltransferase [Polyangiales bacterium]